MKKVRLVLKGDILSIDARGRRVIRILIRCIFPAIAEMVGKEDLHITSIPQDMLRIRGNFRRSSSSSFSGRGNSSGYGLKKRG